MRKVRYEMGRTVVVRLHLLGQETRREEREAPPDARPRSGLAGASARAAAAGAAKAAEGRAARRDRCGLAAAAAHAHGPSRSRACEAVSGKAELVACSAKLVACYHLLQSGAARRGDGVGGREHGRRWRAFFGTPRARRAAPPRRRRFPPRTRARGARLACAVLSRKSAVVRAPKCACMHGARALAVVPRTGVRHSCGLCLHASVAHRTTAAACAQEHVRAWPRPVCGHLRTSVVMPLVHPVGSRSRSLAWNARMPGRTRPPARPTDQPTDRPRPPARPRHARPPACPPPHCTRGRARRKRAAHAQKTRARVQHTREGGCTLPVAPNLRRRVERLWSSKKS